MNTLDKIMITGVKIAQKNGLKSLPEKFDMPFYEKQVEDFINKMIDDLFEFNTMEQFDPTYQNLFNRAFMYSYGKGAETAFLYKMAGKIDAIHFNFGECMKGSLSSLIPKHLMFHLGKNSSTMLDMYIAMFETTKIGEEQRHNEGITFGNCIFKILSGGFYWGKRVMQSIEFSEKDFTTPNLTDKDKFYDPDTYEEEYKVSDYKVINYEIRDFDEIKHLFE